MEKKSRRKTSPARRRKADPPTLALEVPAPTTPAALPPAEEPFDGDRTSVTARPTPLARAGQADIILIAHPDNQKLGTRFRLFPGCSLTIGRSHSAEISLPEVASISRSHARLRYRADAVTIEDLRSTNGTYVNEQRIAKPTSLSSGDRFQVGAIHFKFLQELDVENAYHQAISELVMRDGLTQVFNKRKFEEEAEREFARAKRYGRPLVLLLFDIDHFKVVNDTHGHLCGDFVLKQIAQLVRQVLRREQLFARVGGEEFAILVPEVHPEGVRQLAEKLRTRIAAQEYHYAGSWIRLTCSFGLAQFSPQMGSPRDLYEAADQALYLSKNGGRNRVTFSPAAAPTGP